MGAHSFQAFACPKAVHRECPKSDTKKKNDSVLTCASESNLKSLQSRPFRLSEPLSLPTHALVAFDRDSTNPNSSLSIHLPAHLPPPLVSQCKHDLPSELLRPLRFSPVFPIALRSTRRITGIDSTEEPEMVTRARE